MAQVPIRPGLQVGCAMGGGWPGSVARTSATIDAVGESVGAVGYLQLSTGPGTSKVLSTGVITVVSGATITFADGGTTMRVGLQDVTSGGVEDGTWDVYGEAIGGGGAFAANALAAITMTTGTKTVTHGDLLAVVVEMTTRGGVDSVTLAVWPTNSMSMPYVTADTGAGPVKVSNGPFLLITFDDGTIGYFTEATASTTFAITSFGSGSAPNEYALLFSLPFPATVGALTAFVADHDTGDDGQILLYSDPLGTPVAERTVALSGDRLGQAGSSGTQLEVPVADYALARDTVYAVAYKATTSGTRGLLRRTLGTATQRQACWLGTRVRQGSRNSADAFTEDTTVLPGLGVVLSTIEDGGPTNAEIAQAVWEYENRELTA